MKTERLHGVVRRLSTLVACRGLTRAIAHATRAKRESYAPTPSTV